MKKALRFTALAGILALASWLPADKAQALPPTCEQLNGYNCYPNPPGTRIRCWDQYGLQQRCVCTTTDGRWHYWYCYPV